MTPRIYTSSYPPLSLRNESVFTRLLSLSPDGTKVGTYPASTPQFIDAETGTTLTRGQVRDFSLAVGFGLRNYPHGALKRGDTVLVFAPNSMAWPIILFGAIAAGLKSSLVNSGYTARELTFHYSDGNAKLVFTSEAGLPTVLEMFKSLGVSFQEAQKKIIVIGDGLGWANGPTAPIAKGTAGFTRLEDLLDKGALKTEEKFEGEQANETVFMCYSSGTTGNPKGVETTHLNLIAQLEINRLLVPVDPNVDVILNFLPMYHIFAAVCVLCVPLIVNTPIVLMNRFDPIEFCAAIEKYKISYTNIVPPLLVLLARHPVVDKYDLSSLRIAMCAAAPLAESLVTQVIDRLLSKRRNKEAEPLYITQAYGLTESTGASHYVYHEDSAHLVGAVGKLLPSIECRLVQEGSDIDAPEGQPGEIWLRGPTIMKGYLNNPEATKNTFASDGWFKSGDVGVMDAQGNLYIVDRLKELIKYKGFQVAPAELESLLLKHPEVADAAVIGVESAKEATELPRAYIVPANPASVKTEGAQLEFGRRIQEWIRTQVAKHKFLRGGVVVIDIIPKSPTGKILRKELRERVKHELSGRDPVDDVDKHRL